MGKPAETDRPYLRSLHHSFTLDSATTPSPKNWACDSRRTQLKQLVESSRSLSVPRLIGAPGLRLPEWVWNFSPG
jgi:hypothetical protein